MFRSVWLFSFLSPGCLGAPLQRVDFLCWRVRKAGIPCGCFCSGGAGVVLVIWVWCISPHVCGSVSRYCTAGMIHVNRVLRLRFPCFFRYFTLYEESIDPGSRAAGAMLEPSWMSFWLLWLCRAFTLIRYTPDSFGRGSEFYLGIASSSMFNPSSPPASPTSVPTWLPARSGQCAVVGVDLRRLPRCSSQRR